MSNRKEQPADGSDDGQAPRAYAVGYGKPPVRTRFAKGASGNPKGRKPGCKNLATLLLRELDTKIVVTEKSKRKSKRKGAVLVAQLVNKAVNGDLRATVIVMGTLEKHETISRIAHGDLAASEAVTEADAQVLADFLRRATNAGPAKADPANE